ncbi:MAG TPA: hypothetical protein VM240_13525 [Verrucomicrobiae bacterium]|nr:hypothetical protein [Verrucomicrobiae bacterium]
MDQISEFQKKKADLRMRELDAERDLYKAKINSAEESPEAARDDAPGRDRPPPRKARAWKPRSWTSGFEILCASDNALVKILDLRCHGQVNYLGDNRGALQFHELRLRPDHAVVFHAESDVTGWDEHWRLNGIARPHEETLRHVAKIHAIGELSGRKVATKVWFDRVELGFDHAYCIVQGFVEATPEDYDWKNNKGDYHFAGLLKVSKLTEA